jgi:hypothetical protein
MSDPTNAERQRRFRDRQRAERDPVTRYCRSVIEYDERAQTPASGRLAGIAVDVIEAAIRQRSAPKSIATLMGFGRASVREAVTEAQKVALAGLRRAQAEMEADVAPEGRVPVTEASIRAGLHHAKRLTLAPRKTEGIDAATLAMWAVVLSVPAPDYLTRGEPLTPDAFREPADGQSDPTEDR